ncbi:hypothetical protein KIN20_014312 [Parelaphostrongylus tenuis]|uniref:Uncharacterized protein n=1 Tax=Parelaphostrongylus tenuis TaxID=148309 RepID=A0AAD5MYW9_PARTN|nr:hypothetical protein KIN20_003577 [Parelaphostrongylus tenuis]KAJ1356581.1 hypothetical protein KIN20_014312 [Parelaphostrongylus tenuis]
MNEHKCINVGDTVTGICTTMEADAQGVKCENMKTTKITPIPSSFTSVFGTLSTTNTVMANWSTAMWQNVCEQSGANVGIGSV